MHWSPATLVASQARVLPFSGSHMLVLPIAHRSNNLLKDRNSLVHQELSALLQVHLCGSFTRWVETVPMSPVQGSPGLYSVVVHLPPGYVLAFACTNNMGARVRCQMLSLQGCHSEVTTSELSSFLLLPLRSRLPLHQR